MNHKSRFSEALMAFCVCTTCITILEGTMGMIFFPEETLSYGAFFSPPLFGFISVLFGVVTWSQKELSVKQILFRRFLHLLLIIAAVLGLNYLAGTVFSTLINILLIVGITAVFIMVHVILWINDQKSARVFNQKLKEFQADKRGQI